MSADEGASWAAARAPSLSEVLRLQPLLNPGKLAIHEVALHGWMRLFGDSLAALRSLSALAGTLAIVAVFFVAREIFADVSTPSLFDKGEGKGERGRLPNPHQRLPSDGDMLAALGALIFAINLVTIKYSQEARMYPLALLFALMQMGFLVRIARTPTVVGFILAAFFTMLAIACTFTMALMLPPEALWLTYRVWRPSFCHPEPAAQGAALSKDLRAAIGLRERFNRAAFAAAALAAGLFLLILPATIYLHVRAHAPALTAYAWASPPPPWAPLSLFNKATGSFAFPLMLGLAVWGAVRGWQEQREGVVLMLIWMLLPPLIVMSASYLIRPAFVERYMLASFVPFLVLVALGIWYTPGVATRFACLALVGALAIAHVYAYERRPHDTQWREAVQAAAAATDGAIAVAPPYAVGVVRYYLRDSPREWSVLGARDGSPAPVAIIAETGASTAEAAHVASGYPHLRVRLRGVIVRER
jgi:hypothetical protein